MNIPQPLAGVDSLVSLEWDLAVQPGVRSKDDFSGYSHSSCVHVMAFLINGSSSSITLPSLFIDVLFSDVDIRNIYNVSGSRVTAVKKPTRPSPHGMDLLAEGGKQ